jgi:hypothetical protein
MLEPRTNVIHLSLVLAVLETRSAASDIAALRRARTNRDMRVQVLRVVMQSVGVSYGIAGMKFLGEFAHRFFEAGMQNVIGIDSGGDQRVVLFSRHRENQPMRDDRTAGLRREFFQVMLPGFRDAPLALRVRKLGGRGAGAVAIAANLMVQKSSRVNLSERFLGGVVGEVFQLPSDLLLHVGALAQRNFPAGGFIEVFQIQPPAGGGFTREDLPVVHVSESRISKA